MNSLILILNAIALLATGPLHDTAVKADAGATQPSVAEFYGPPMPNAEKYGPPAPFADQSIYESAAVRRQLEILSTQPQSIPLHIPQSAHIGAIA
jgi:hypothetical protein